MVKATELRGGTERVVGISARALGLIAHRTTKKRRGCMVISRQEGWRLMMDES